MKLFWCLVQFAFALISSAWLDGPTWHFIVTLSKYQLSDIYIFHISSIKTDLNRKMIFVVLKWNVSRVSVYSFQQTCVIQNLADVQHHSKENKSTKTEKIKEQEIKIKKAWTHYIKKVLFFYKKQHHISPQGL